MYFVVAFLLFDISCCTASLASTFPDRKFASWFSTYGAHFETSSVQNCNATLQAYLNNEKDINSRIADHADCILANTTETIKANMGSAGVILGLMPGILANLGPTLAESSILTLERPFLSTLLILGGPSLYPDRPFKSWDPLEVIKQPPNRFLNMPKRWSSSIAVGLLQYIIALIASVNVITVSLELGMKTVLLWRKPNSYLPLTWVLLSIFVHMGAALRLYLYKKSVPSSPRHQCSIVNHNVLNPSHNVRPIHNMPSKQNIHPTPRQGQILSHLPRKVLSIYHVFRNILKAEIHPCGTHTKLRLPSTRENENRKESFASYLLAVSLPILGLIHVAVGVTIFSSLDFIGVADTVDIVVRYSLSTLAVQLVRSFEAAGLFVAYQDANTCGKL